MHTWQNIATQPRLRNKQEKLEGKGEAIFDNPFMNYDTK